MPAPNPSDKNKDKIAITVENGPNKNTKEMQQDDLSEEDKSLKEGLELAVVRLQDSDESLHRLALEHLVTEIRSSTSSMTSVPKPLKFLRGYYDILKSIYSSWSPRHEMKLKLADVLSVLAMTMSPPGNRECLKYKLLGTKVDISSWGHEYVRSLTGEISEEYNFRALETPPDEEPVV